MTTQAPALAPHFARRRLALGLTALGLLQPWPSALGAALAPDEDTPAAALRPPPPGSLRLALLHLAPQPGQIAANRQRIESAIRAAAARGADWIITPELAETGYNFARRIGTDWIAPFPDPWMTQLAALAAELRVALFIGFAEREAAGGRLHNSVAVIDRSGRILGRYRKQAVVGGAERWSTPGGEGRPFDVDGIPVGVLICADAWRPEAAARYREQGAAILISPANWPPVDDMGPGDVWERRSAETGLPLVVTNRSGAEPELDFTHGVSAVAVGGQRLHSFSSATSRIFLVDWDRASAFVLPETR